MGDHECEPHYLFISSSLLSPNKVVYDLFAYNLSVSPCEGMRLHMRESVREHDVHYGFKF